MSPLHSTPVLALWLVACAGPPPRQVCELTCDELVTHCGVAAYPSHDSCMEGCLYDAEVGAPVHAVQGCVAEAECDLFAVAQCARVYGGAE